MDGEEDADAYAGEQEDGGLALVAEPELMGLGAPVHPGQRAENGVADQLRMPGAPAAPGTARPR